jgi:Tol biopolymer transport system component/DNA-binding winged helix-turn-helix (wHTH) protein
VSPPRPTLRIARFGAYEADLEARQLFKRGIRVRIQEQPFRILSLLLEEPGALVTREQLRRAVWPDNTFVDFDKGLNAAVAKLRRALVDSAENPRFIETQARQGYRFICPVAWADKPGAIVRPESGGEPEEEASAVDIGGSEVETTAVSAGAPTFWRRGLITPAFAAIVLAAVAGILFWKSRTALPALREWVQITKYSDSATSPSVSADGRVLTFIRGANTFYGPGDVYIQILPDGEPAALTHDGSSKMSPVIAPDGSRVAYTVVDDAFGWNTFVAPLFGGAPERLLANAAGLGWIGPHQVMFSEVKSGAHMAIVTAGESRTDQRDVYVPPHDRGMAHRSAISPDRKNVLIVEMDDGGWLPCRVVPFDGSSNGRRVGPPQGACTHAAWSPDGVWMYLNSDAGGAGYHLWRQRFRGGDPEQITYGPTEQEGIAMIPDGRSIISSVGMVQSSIWIHGPDGERRITSEESASWPLFAHDGSALFYTSSASEWAPKGELWRLDLGSRQRERIVEGKSITGYDVSRDDKQAVFSTLDSGGHSRLWVSPLDRSSPPRQIPGIDLLQSRFAPNGDLAFIAVENQRNYLYRSRADGSSRERLIADPVLEFYGISPDGKWAIVWAAVAGEDPASSSAILAYPIAGQHAIRICTNCAVTWSQDARFIYLIQSGSVYRMALRDGQVFPVLPPDGVRSTAEIARIPGAVLLASEGTEPAGDPSFVVGKDPSMFVFMKATVHRNLYRIPIQ